MVFYSKKQNALYDGYCMFIIAPIIVGSSFGPADTLPLGGGGCYLWVLSRFLPPETLNRKKW